MEVEEKYWYSSLTRSIMHICFLLIKELLSTAQMSTPDRLETVSNRLEMIARHYVSAERYFPVGKLAAVKIVA